MFSVSHSYFWIQPVKLLQAYPTPLFAPLLPAKRAPWHTNQGAGKTQRTQSKYVIRQKQSIAHPKNPHLSSTYPAFTASPSPCLEATFAPPTVQEGGASWRLPARSRWPRTCPRYVPSCRSCCGSWGKPCPFLMHIRWTSTRSLCGRNWLICPQRRCCRRSGRSRRRQRRAP